MSNVSLLCPAATISHKKIIIIIIHKAVMYGSLNKCGVQDEIIKSKKKIIMKNVKNAKRFLKKCGNKYKYIVCCPPIFFCACVIFSFQNSLSS